jgi:hypothetical protein
MNSICGMTPHSIFDSIYILPVLKLFNHSPDEVYLVKKLFFFKRQKQKNWFVTIFLKGKNKKPLIFLFNILKR